MNALSIAIGERRVNWIIDADIQNFFGAVSQEWLVRFLEHRTGDKRIIRLIQEWLRAGILEDGIVIVDDRGTGQGGLWSADQLRQLALAKVRALEEALDWGKKGEGS